MKYYTLITSRKESIIGKYPQVIGDNRPREWFYPPLNEIIRYDNFLNFDNYFDIIVDDDAILTDIIERVAVSWGMIINEKLKFIISELNIPPHRFYPINVKYREENFQYYWFHFYDNIFKYIDLESSKFEIYYTSNFEILKTLSITSESFIRDIQNSFNFEKNMRLKNLDFTESFPKYDLWLNNVWGFGNIISEKLVKIFEYNKITGYEINDCKYLKYV